MSAFPNNKNRVVALKMKAAAVASLLFLASPFVEASIVLEGRPIADSRQRIVSTYPAYSATAYAMARSHAWMRYERTQGMGEVGMVAVPYAGAWRATTPREASLRNNLSRAQAYRIGGRW